MIQHKVWVVWARRRGRWSGKKDTWRIEREGWFLLGLVPLYVRDLAATQE